MERNNHENPHCGEVANRQLAVDLIRKAGKNEIGVYAAKLLADEITITECASGVMGVEYALSMAEQDLQRATEEYDEWEMHNV